MTYAPQPQPQQRKRFPLKVILAIVGTLLLGLCIFGVAYNATKAARESGSPVFLAPDPSAPGSKAPAAAPKVKTFGEGTYEVGAKSDPQGGTIKPGTFILVTEEHCYWVRLSAFDGSVDSILASDILQAKNGAEASARITVKSSDKGLKLEGDCTLGQKGGLK